tara:strand:+ start:33791 stop:34045 length:255 start_codon:yes stop_codon:yes gene_type:complete
MEKPDYLQPNLDEQESFLFYILRIIKFGSDLERRVIYDEKSVRLKLLNWGFIRYFTENQLYLELTEKGLYRFFQLQEKIKGNSD